MRLPWVGYFQCTDFKIIGNKIYDCVIVRVIYSHKSHVLRIKSAGLIPGDTNTRVFYDTGFRIARYFHLLDSCKFHILFRTGYPKCLRLMELEQSFEVNISLVHHIESEWFRREHIKFVTVMPFPISNMDIGRDASSQIKQCVHLDGSLAVFAQSPRREFYAGGYGSGVQRIDYIVYRYLGQPDLGIHRSYQSDEISP